MFALKISGMDIYIDGISCISPQETFDSIGFLDTPVPHSGKFLQACHPNYKTFIKPIQLRRMTKLIRMGIVTAKQALKDAGVVIPDAIVTGTGLGSVSDTEKFLNMMLEHGENIASPTSFINSTHNTVGSHIAVLLGCHKYNLNYVHYSTAFESALIDAIMLLQEGESQNVLAGGFDELTEENYQTNRYEKIWKEPIDNVLELFDSGTPGVIPGESAAFFLLSAKQTSSTYARLKDVQSIFNPESEQLRSLLEEMLDKQGLTIEEIDFVLAGFNGDPANDNKYHSFINSTLPQAEKLAYKHLSGEHETASAFALWSAARVLKEQQVPKVMRMDKKNNNLIRHILIYNFNFKLFNNHTFILLSV